MSAIKTVVIQTKAPRAGDRGQATEGFYTVEDGVLQMVYRDGRPLDNPLYSVRLGDADANAVAGKLTLDIHREMKGNGFGRSLDYPALGVA